VFYNERMNGFSELLRSRRETQGLEQAELARLLGVTQQTVSKWETGVTVPRPTRVAALARTLDLDPGLLHAAAADGEAPASADSTGRGLPAGIRLDRLGQDELVTLLDAVWRELSRRRRQRENDSHDSRR
jgi:transcriptional regulator with XRE-family HTH domain